MVPPQFTAIAASKRCIGRTRPSLLPFRKAAQEGNSPSRAALPRIVRQLVRNSGYPNMKVLEFAFDPSDALGYNEYLPHNYETNCVVYTGTHDNETMAGWLRGLEPETMNMVRAYLGDQTTPDRLLHRQMARLAMMSGARICILPIQDYLGLDNRCRINRPGTVTHNWSWRLRADALTDRVQAEILTLTRRYGRMR